MTAHVMYRDRTGSRVAPQRRTRRRGRWLEYLLLFAGLIALDCVIWVSVDSMLEQRYGDWSLDQQIRGQHPTVRGFIANQLHLPWLAPAPEALPKPAVPANAKLSSPARKAPKLPAFALIGRLEVPRLGLDAIVREGVEASTLRTAVGHMPSTVLPGQAGNAAFAAHRDTLFRKLRDIRKDDRITLETVDGTYEYVVESLKIVNPTDVGVLKASKDDRLLTLITCYPFNYIGSAPHRFIVRAREVESSARSPRSQNPAKS